MSFTTQSVDVCLQNQADVNAVEQKLVHSKGLFRGCISLLPLKDGVSNW